MIKNMSESEVTWTDENGAFRELVRQEYTGNNCVFSGGAVEGAPHPDDVYYLRWSKDGVEPTTLLLRPDEVAAVAWLCAGLLWGHTIEEKEKT